MRILITAANSAEAHRLKSKLATDNIILGDYNELPEFMVRTGKMISLPNPNSVAYTHQMLTLCMDQGITTVYALNEQERALLTESEQLFKEYDINILTITNEI